MSHEQQLPDIQIHQTSHIGRVRHENQDSMGYKILDRVPYQDSHLLVVADGMGGASGGQVASQIAVENLLAYFGDRPNMEPDVALREAIEFASDAILRRAEEEPSLTGMGTTCVVVLYQHGYMFAGHVGDSRIYLLRDGVLHRMTRDHTAVQRLVEAGILTEDEAENHRNKNVLSRVLGSEHRLHVEIMAPPWKLQEGDRVMLCSDGLHGEVSEDEIAATLAASLQKDTSQTLVDMANAAGGRDNVTVQVLAVGEIPEKAVAATNVPPAASSMEDKVASSIFQAIVLLILFAIGYIAGFNSVPPSTTKPSATGQNLAGLQVRHTPPPLLRREPDTRRIPAENRRPVPTRSMKAPTRSMKQPTRSMKQPTQSKKPVANCNNPPKGATTCQPPARGAVKARPAAAPTSRSVVARPPTSRPTSRPAASRPASSR